MATKYPTLRCAIAFASQPMASVQAWTDVTSRLRGQIALKRGRQNELNRIEAGTLKCCLDNRDGALTKSNSASPYYPNVKIRRRIRVQATWGGVPGGTQTISLSGATGLFRLAYGAQTTGGLGSGATAGQVQAALAQLGSIGVGNVAVTGPAGGPFVVSLLGGLSGGAVLPLIIRHALASSTAPTVTTTTAAALAHNKVIRVTVGGATGGTLTCLASPAISPYDFPTFVPAGNAQAVDSCDYAYGPGNTTVAVVLPGQTWDVTFTGALALSNTPSLVLWSDTLTPAHTGAVTVMQTGNAPVAMIQRIQLGTPTAGVWQVTAGGQTTGDLAWNASAAALQTALQALSSIGSGNCTVSSPSSGVYDVTIGGSLTGMGLPLTVAARLTGGSWAVTIADTPGTTYDLFTGFLESLPVEEPDGAWADAKANVTAIDGLGLLARSKINGSLGAAVPTTTTTTQGGPGVSEVQLLSLNGATSGSFRLRFSGQTTGSLAWNATAAAVQTALRALPAIGAAGIAVSGAAGGPYTMTFGGALANSDQAPIVANLDFPGQRSDLMVAAVLDAVGWPAADRLLDAGISTLADAVITKDTPALQLLLKIADSENGVVFCDASARVVFQNRYQRTQQGAPLATFSDQPTGAQLPYATLLPSDDDTAFFNEVTVTAAGGSPQIARDAASIAEYWIATYQRTDTLIASDTEAGSASQWLLSRRAIPATRIPAIILRGVLDPARLWPELLGRAIGDRIRVIKHPRGGGLIDQDVYIEQLEVKLSRGEKDGKIDAVWQWQLSSAQTTGYWIVGDVVWGVLGVTTKLAY
jgi:hypothetical protein